MSKSLNITMNKNNTDPCYTKQQIMDRLEHNLKQQSLLAHISSSLNMLSTHSEKITDILRLIGVHTAVSRVYIFEDLPGGQYTDNTYEWCNKGIAPQMDNLKNICYNIIPSWKKLLFEKGRIFSDNINKLPKDLKAVLGPQNIKSILVFPIQSTDDFFGFIGFDECCKNKIWKKDEIDLLNTIANMIASTFERFKYHDQLIKSRENLKIANSTKDKLFSIIAHDLRGAIGSMMQTSELISIKGSVDEETLYKFLASQKAISQKTYFLLENLLSWARLNRTQITCRPREFDIKELIKNHLETRPHSLPKHKNIKITTTFRGTSWVYADIDMIKLVMRNLLSNALKFTPSGGKINISTCGKDNNLTITVKDTGIGIKKENIPKILSNTQFFTTFGTKNEKGTGLGLKLCKKFIALNKGTFKIKSTYTNPNVSNSNVSDHHVSAHDLSGRNKQKKKAHTKSGTKIIFTLPLSSDFIDKPLN
jgi:signal transduction histidine kinase